MKREIGIAILGLGVIGSNVLKILQDNKEFFLKKYELEIIVHSVYVRDVTKKRNVALDNIKLTNDIYTIVEDSRVDVVIECMGGNGVDDTINFILKLVENKKNIIMSSKKCLAKYADKITDYVNRYGVELRYDATVGGGIMITKILQNLSGYDNVSRIYGIVNASTNYVLSLMAKEDLSVEAAIDEAKKRGYAENNPSEDVDGWDALYKMIILLRFGLGININQQKILPNKFEMLENIKKSDTKACIKQVFSADMLENNRVKVYVGPANVKNTMLEKVDDINNIIFVNHKYGGTRAYYGSGAGGQETASVMIEDLIDLLRYKRPLKKVSDEVEVQQLMGEELFF